jgi:N-methylhydantoinase B
MTSSFDPILVEVIGHELGAITEEMALVIWRSGQSPMLKTGDFATAICDPQGRVIGQGFAAPFQLAALDDLMMHVVKKYGTDFSKGDVIITNDPYSGMGHMPDVGIVVPVVIDGRIAAFCVTYSHHSDMGGRFPGSASSKPQSSYEEGLRLPIMKIVEKGCRNEEIFQVIGANVRVPQEWFGDLQAKIAGCNRGADETEALIRKYGWDSYLACCEHVLKYAEISMRRAIEQAPKGTYNAEYVITDDGVTEDGTIVLRMAMTISNDEMIFDFTGSSPQVRSALNTPLTTTKASVFGALKTVIGPDLPTNHGFFAPVKIIAPPGCVLNPIFPAAVGGRAPVFFRIFDLVYSALSKAMPDQVPVIGEGGDLLHFSGTNESGDQFAFLDLFFGGWGGRPTVDGVDGVAPVFMGSYGCVSSELVEAHNPVVYESFGFVADSEGAGRHRGSPAIRRVWRFLEDGHAMVRSVRLHPASGMSGGLAGRAPQSSVQRGGRTIDLPLKTHVHVDVLRGDVISHSTAGAGGFGNPFERDPEAVCHDWKVGLISRARARDVYGVTIKFDGSVDAEETRILRRTSRASAERPQSAIVE